MFRRVVLHLSAIQDHNSLYVEPLSIERSWTIPADSVTAEGFKTLEQEYRVAYNAQDKTFTLRKQVEGGTLITNYDPNLLSREERARLHDENVLALPHDVTFDIRPGHLAATGRSRETFACAASMPCSTFSGSPSLKSRNTLSTKTAARLR